MKKIGALLAALIATLTLATAADAASNTQYHDVRMSPGDEVTLSPDGSPGTVKISRTEPNKTSVVVGSSVRVNKFEDGKRIALIQERKPVAVVRIWVDADGVSETTKQGSTFLIRVRASGSTTTTTTSTTTTTAPTTTTTTAPTSTPTTTPSEEQVSQDPSGTAKFPARHSTVYGYEGSGRSGFISRCSYVKTNTVDPIVYPGDKTRSHAHDFFGNTSTDENTTSDSLITSGETSCKHADDLASYWTPSAIDGGRQANAVGTSMYYFTDRVSNAGSMKPHPVGLRMIAGSANATGPQSGSIASFEEHRNAGNNTRSGGTSMITANQTGQVTVRINFPQCWDGKRLDSPDHKSHMAYTVSGSCPSTHPVLLPQLTEFVRYDADGGSDFSLSSGPWYTAHADFWNAWHPDTYQEILNHCRTTHCGVVRSS